MSPLLLTALILCSSPQDDVEKKVATLLERLRADDIEAREAASQAMIDLGEPAVEFVEKAAAGSSEPATIERLKTISTQIRRQAQIKKAAPPAKLVTISAKEQPLRDFLKDACGQAGIEYAYDGATGDEVVTVEAKDEPLLSVIDRACEAHGNLMTFLVDSKIKVIAGKGAGDPRAYVDGYRLRVKKTAVTDLHEAGSVKTSVALYFEVDAPPDHQVRGVSLSAARTASAGEEELQIRNLAEAKPRLGAWMPEGLGALMVDGVAVSVEAAESLDRICLIKDLPAGLQKIDSVKIGARFRYSVGLRAVTVPLTIRSSDKLPDIPYNVMFSGQQLYFMPVDPARPSPLEEFIDPDSMVVITKDGKETKVSSLGGGMRGRQYSYQIDNPVQGTDNPTLRINVIDAFDRDVEFELKGIKIR